ncbi:MAG: HD-GYP domain-containing protein [Treponema sp.]|nr:HD-GYP domain-containing protein [Treponema sp.]
MSAGATVAENGDESTTIKKFKTRDIPQESYFSEPVYADEKLIILSPEMPFTREMKKTLEDWEFLYVYSSGDISENYSGKGAQGDKDGDLLNIESSGDGDKIIKAREFYADFLTYVNKIFTNVVLGNELSFSTLATDMKLATEIIREERRFLLRVMKNTHPDDNYLASHTVKSTIIAVIIGSYLKLPNHRLIELGVSALLHEIGMLKLPSKTYLSREPLTAKEHEAIASHPILSYNLLKSFDFPLTVTLASLEHHERENGSGYPRQLTGERISLYAKIIGVACSYDALSSQRPYKEPKDGYTGMLELLKNEDKQYDETVIRALVFSLSIYPIGLYVLLSTGQKGQVVDVNPENPRYPYVQVFGELNPDGKNKVFETTKDGLSIVRPLSKEEIS